MAVQHITSNLTTRIKKTKLLASASILLKGTIHEAIILRKHMCQCEKVQVGKYQEKAQSEKDSHSKNRGGKKTLYTPLFVKQMNNLCTLTEYVVSKIASTCMSNTF